ncbi:MAG TPA: hypothetical protein VHP63_06820 [candidate division Zixibacteria bacterium]|nr:hypothetical protein [candidate division Zixibacteria bacterium]
MKSFLTAGLILAAFGQKALAQDDSILISNQTIIIKIDSAVFDHEHLLDTVDIILNNTGLPIAGFDLNVGISSRALRILEVLSGEVLYSCNWETFNAKNSIGGNWEGAPIATWQILGLAEFMPDSIRPLCYGLERPASIARLVVELDSNLVRTSRQDFWPIYFYWQDCSDNTVTNTLGDSLFMSVSVDGISYSDSTGTAFKFPTRYGTPNSCIKPKAQNKPTRKVALVNGGVRLGTVVDK